MTVNERSEFYPTPKKLIDKMINKIDYRQKLTVLECSAGKGDIVRGILLNNNDEVEIEVDCVEIDANLRQILKYNFSEEKREELRNEKKSIVSKYSDRVDKDFGNNYYYMEYNEKSEKWERHILPDEKQSKLAKLDTEINMIEQANVNIVHDNFFTYKNYKEYDLLILNPPFSNGDKHLLKALDIQKNGGQIICLLNAETIRNPYTETRKELLHILDNYNAEIEYVENAFSDAERKADVDIAIINVNIPKNINDNEKSFFEKVAERKEYSEPMFEEFTEIDVADFIKVMINRYKIEVESGIELIRAYQRMIPYLNTSFDKNDYHYNDVMLELVINEGFNTKKDLSINRYVQKVRYKYWKALLTNKEFIGKLPSKVQELYREKIFEFSKFDFSEFNIKALTLEINAQIKTSIEEEAIVMFDKLTVEHAYYPECTKNRYLFNGWNTNKAWKIDKKVIIPNINVFDDWSGKPRTSRVTDFLSDVERILNFFSGNMTSEINLSKILDINFSKGITKNIECKYFELTFYKKGTVHIKFTCPEVIERFNIFVAKNKNWLPTAYGTKKYQDMTAEEKTVIDSFQGEKEYNKVLEQANYYLASPTECNVTLLECCNEEKLA